MIDYLLFGDKKVDPPRNCRQISQIERCNLGIRSRQNLALLENTYNINWYEFLKISFYRPYHYYSDQGHNRYIAYGWFDDKNITYDMYKHGGRNIGNVFLRFGNGKKINNSVVTQFYPNYNLEWVSFIEKIIVKNKSKMTQVNKFTNALTLLESIAPRDLKHIDKLLQIAKKHMNSQKYQELLRDIFNEV